MPNWTGGIITARGRELQAKVEAGETLVITKMKLGSGTPQAYEMDTLTDLKQPLMEFGISSKTVENNICEVTGVVVSSEIETPFYAREWGLFAQDPDEGEILYMYTTDPNPDFIPAKTAALQISATYALNIVVLNVDNIIVNIDPNGLVTTAILKNELKKYLPLSGGDMTGDITANNVYANNSVLVFNNVEEMKASNKVKAGYTLRTLGFYTAGDGGGADYVITNDIGEDEADEASIIALQKGLYAKLLIQDYVNVKWFGAKLDGVTDDSASFNKAVVFLKNKYKVFELGLKDITGTGNGNSMHKHTNYALFIPSGIMKINNTLELEMRGTDYIFDNTVIDATEIETTAFLLKGTTDIAYGSDSGMTTKIDGCALISDRKDNNVAITFDNTVVNRNICFYNVQINGFNKQVYLKDHTYMLNFINCNCGDGYYFAYTDDDSLDLGERITFIGCCLGGFDTVFYCHNSAVTFFVDSSSIDYNKTIFDLKNSKIIITGSHIEWNSPTYLGKMAGASPYVSITNSEIFYNGQESQNELIYNTSTGTVDQGRIVLNNNKLIYLDKFPYLITQGFCVLRSNVTEYVGTPYKGVCAFVQKTYPKIYIDNNNTSNGGCTIAVNENRDNLEIVKTGTGGMYVTFNKKIEPTKLYSFACVVEAKQNINVPVYLTLSWVVKSKDNTSVEVLKRDTINITDILNESISTPKSISDVLVTSNNALPYTSFASDVYARIVISADNLPEGNIINLKRLELAEW